MMNRRQFNQCLLSMAGVPLGFLNTGVFAAGNPAIAVTHRRLVLVELAGANDGLNTLVPYDNDHYHGLRPTLGLRAKDVLALNDTAGLHPSLRGLARLWEQGQMAWVQGLGYPKPNRSHFKSISLWETAGDGHSARSDRGWITHAIEHRMARRIADPHGISLAGDMDIFASDSGRWLSFGSTHQISTDLLPAQDTAMTDANAISHNGVALVQQRLRTLDSTLSRLEAKVRRASTVPQFEGGEFGEQLRQVATLINAGVDTPVYRVRLEGFDTHHNQPGRHARLLKKLSRGLLSFSNTLNGMQEWQNTLIMTYSEFGRRAAENSSAGTDHGTAAPHLVLGGAINGGLYGDAPNLADLPDGDPLHTMDYRALYHQMLVSGLGAESVPQQLADYADERLSRLFRS